MAPQCCPAGSVTTDGVSIDPATPVAAGLHKIISRPRVLDLLARGLERRLLLMVAPPGYGKTIALTEAVHRLSRPVVWLACESDDSSALALSQGLLERAVGPPSRLRRGSLPSDSFALARHVIRTLGDAYPGGCQIVMDNGDECLADDGVVSFLRDLIEVAPSSLHFAVVARAMPALWMPGLARATQVARITKEHLAFTPDEVGGLLRVAWGGSVTSDSCAAAWDLTEGWPQGLRRLLARFPHPAGAGELRAAQEPGIHPGLPDAAVLPHGSDRELLFAAAFLPRITPSSVDQVTGVPGMWERVAALASASPLFSHAGRFQMTIDPMVRQQLQTLAVRELEGSTINRYRVTAGRLLEAEGDLSGALERYLAAGDGTGVARILRATGLARPSGWDPTRFVSLADRLKVCHDLNPESVTVCAVADWIRGERERSGMLCREGLRRARSAGDRLPLLVIRATAECMNGAGRDSWEQPELRDLMDDDALSWARVWKARCMLHRGLLAEAEHLLRGAERRLERAGDVFHARWACLCEADLHTQRGHYGPALTVLGTSSGSRGTPDAVLDMRMLELRAALRTAMGEPHMALADAQDALVMARVLGADQRAGAHLALLAGMAFNSGELSMGRAWLGEAEALSKASEQGQDAAAALHAARAREAWGLGRIDDAVRWWRECLRGRACWFSGAWHGLEAAVVFWRAGTLDAARSVADDTIREARQRGATHVLANARLLEAYIAHEAGAGGDASQRLHEVLRSREREGFSFFPAADPLVVQWASALRVRGSARGSLSGGMPPAGSLGRTALAGGSPPKTGVALSISTLGPLHLRMGDRDLDEDVWKSRMKAKRFLELLLSSRSHRVNADEAVELLWPRARPGRGRHRLQCTASDLRKVLDATGMGAYLQLRFRQPSYELAFDPGRVTVSHEVFDQISQEALAGPFTAESVAILRRAAALYLGEYLEDARYDRFTDSQRQNLARRMGQILRALASHADSPEEALAWWQRAADHDPYDEEACRGLIQTAHAIGKPERVSAGLAALRERIVDDLGLPMPSWTLAVTGPVGSPPPTIS